MVVSREVVSDEGGSGRDRVRTHVGSVAGTDDETTIKYELHVTGSTGFCAGSRDMLANIRRWGDDLGFADIVIFDINDLQEITNVLIVVDDLADAADEMDDCLGHPVTWSGFAAEDRNPRCELLALFGTHGFDGEIAVNDAEDVELLAFVFVYSLHLDVEKSFWIYLDAGGIHDVLRQTDLVGVLDLLPFFLEVLVIQEMLEFVKFC